jgi:hypothetical protein
MLCHAVPPAVNRPSTKSPEAIAVTLVIVPSETVTEIPAPGSALFLPSLGVINSSAPLALLSADGADATGDGCWWAAGARSQAAAIRARTATTAAPAARTGRSLITRSYRTHVEDVAARLVA